MRLDSKLSGPLHQVALVVLALAAPAAAGVNATGNQLAGGDFDGDGSSDLAIGVHGENDWAGAVAILHGD